MEEAVYFGFELKAEFLLIGERGSGRLWLWRLDSSLLIYGKRLSWPVPSQMAF